MTQTRTQPVRAQRSNAPPAIAPDNALAQAGGITTEPDPLAKPADDTTQTQPEANAPRSNATAVEPAYDANENDEPADDETQVGGEDRGPGQFKRIPFGGQLPKLSAEPRPGYRRYWFLSEVGRIDQAKGAGYAMVMKDGKPRTITAGVGKDGKPKQHYLMEIPIEWFREDMAAQQREVDEIDRAIRGGQLKKVESGYVPAGGIKFTDE